METVLTIEVPDELARRARALAEATNRRVEDVIVEWISRAVVEPAVESLPDRELLAACDEMMDDRLQEELSDFLADLREGALADSARGRLEELMAAYRAGMVRKALALKEAVARGLRPGLGDDAL